MLLLSAPRTLLSFILIFLLTGALDIPDETQRYQMVEGKICAVIIDMQPLYLYGIREKENDREIPYMLETLEFCYRNDIPIFTVETEGAGDTIKVLKEKLDACGARNIQKQNESGFDGTELMAELNREGVKTILLMGINASVCVKKTAEQALDLGYEICTSKDLIAEPAQWRFGYKTYESRTWYEANGVYCDRYEDLLYILSNCLDYNKVFVPQLAGRLPV